MSIPAYKLISKLEEDGPNFSLEGRQNLERMIDEHESFTIFVEPYNPENYPLPCVVLARADWNALFGLDATARPGENPFLRKLKLPEGEKPTPCLGVYF